MIQRSDKPGDWKNCGKPLKLRKKLVKKNKNPSWEDCACAIHCDECRCFSASIKKERK